MIQSMTGYGKAELNLSNANLTIEIRSLNSKHVDLNVKMPSIYKENEIKLRKLLSEKLQRGKIELSIWREKSAPTSNYTLNIAAIKDYHKQILKLQQELSLKSTIWSASFYELGLNKSDIIPTLLKMPDVIQKGGEEVDKNEWGEIEKGVNTAIAMLLEFRLDEGRKLEDDIAARINQLAGLSSKIAPFATARIAKVKDSLSEKLEKLDSKNIDNNRFEQELIYYLEKQDITEEQVRLSAHLNYFIETMKANSPNGKKLGFICQEIGREINTIGSKSSDAEMQKIVVQMKDELEKIKEQLLNIL